MKLMNITKANEYNGLLIDDTMILKGQFGL